MVAKFTCLDVSDKHAFKYNPEWRVVNVSTGFYKNKTGFDGIVVKNSLTRGDYMYLGSSTASRNLASLMVYCDFHRQLYPIVLGVATLPDNEATEILDALYNRGYRQIPWDASYGVPETEYLLLYRDQTDYLEKLV